MKVVKILASAYWLLWRVQRRLVQNFDLRKYLFASHGSGVTISRSAYIPYPKTINVGSFVHLADYCALISRTAKIIIGDRTTVNTYARVQATDGDIKFGQDCTLNYFSMVVSGPGGVKIGNGVRIGPQTLLLGANHIFEAGDIPIWEQGMSSKGIVIEDDVWIGGNVTVLDGVDIGKGSVVGAGAVVTESVPPYVVAVGVPAKVIRER